MRRKKTHEEFLKEVYDLVGDEYKVLGLYESAKTKIKMLHTICRKEYDIKPDSFTSKGSRCPECARNKKKDTEQFKKEVYDLVGDEYKVLGLYEGAKTKIKMRHTTCRHEYDVLPNNFTSKGSRCPKCESQKKNTEQFKKEVYALVGTEYKVLGEYVTNKTKIKMFHTTCRHEYDVLPNNFTSKGSRCPMCYGTSKKTTEQFKKEIYDLVGDEYQVLGEYINTDTKIKMSHTKCGHKYDVTPNNFTSIGNRCPKCSESKGEKKISEVLTLLLDANKYDFNSQYSIPNCRDKLPLPFDNYIKQGDNLLALIEYDGIQHFKPVKWTSSMTDEEARKNLEETQRRDRIKTKYCKKHGIPLIRIKYTQYDNIEEILIRELTALGIIHIDEDNKIKA